MGLLVWTLCLVPGEGFAAEELVHEKYFGWVDVGPASVGTPTRVSWRLQGEASASKPLAALTLTITHLEKSKTVFSVERLPVTGEFAMSFQFTESAEYRVAAIAFIPGRHVVRTERHVSVTGVEPPSGAVISAMGLFLAVIAGGLWVGRWSRPRAHPPPGR